MHLETKRLTLRPFKADDLEAYLRVVSDEAVMKYIGACRAKNQKEAKQELTHWIDHQQRLGYSQWAIIEKSSQNLIGRAGLCELDSNPEIEVGYLLQQQSWGKGYATEVAQASIDFGITELELDNIYAVTREDNKASQRVLEKCGLKKVGFRKYYNTQCVFFALDESKLPPLRS